jgi:SAM-dependent methyltransferase
MKAKLSADPIREFYTNHPYPPPLENLDRAREVYRDENVVRAEYHLYWPHKKYRADLDVLVAGCGTWQSAKFALCHPEARVLGIDVSTTSLEHTETLKRKYDLANLETRQLPIESAAELNRSFDLIVCTGVLHHLADPEVGLRALRSALKQDGALYLMLYAPYGRVGVSMLQEYCRRLGVGTSPQEIDDLTAVLKAMPQHHPLLSMLRGARDAANAGALIDALLNPRDRTYSVAQLFDFLERNDLTFGRWYWQAAYSPLCGAISATPHAHRLAALPERDQFALTELWRGLITNHDFIAYRSDSNRDDLQVRFDDQRHLRYVPIRRPWTICVQDRVPPGVAGALLNQTHLFDDLYVFIDAQEKAMFDAIDGRRSVGEIVETVGGESSHSSQFFDKLWWHDQVVFDTSKAT